MTSQSLVLDPQTRQHPLRTPEQHHHHFHAHEPATSLPLAKSTKLHPKNTSSGSENASIYFVGTATTILEWSGIRLMTDPNFLHAGDHVHLGPGVTGTRKTNPALDLNQLPGIDVVLLSHYHADHFDQDVEASLNRALPIITTPHAKSCLTSKPDGEAFTAVYELDTYQDMVVDIKNESAESTSGGGRRPAIKVTAMPGKHVPPGVLGTINDILGAVPPINGWMLQLGYKVTPSTFIPGYTIYITGDTLLVDELEEIPARYPSIDLMLVHLGGTTIPSPALPLFMVTMDAEQGVKIMQMMDADVTIPVHYDDYDVFLSPLKDFKEKVEEKGWEKKVVYLDRGEEFKFEVRDGKKG